MDERSDPGKKERGLVVHDALSQMIDALGLEVAALRKRGGGTHVELRGGERVGQTEDKWLYRFPLGEDLRLRDDTPVRLTCGGREAAGELVSFRDGVVLVALEADLGARIALARLVADDSFLVERLKERLEKVRSGEAAFNRSSAQRVIGEASAHSGDAEPHAVVLQGDRPLNEEQRAAIYRSLGSDATFVWGPPGTGKTFTVARAVEAHYRIGRSVLLVSNTNIAVDTALEMVAKRLMGEPDFHQGAVLRQGPVVKDELRQRFGPQVILEDVVARLGEGLCREKEELQNQTVALQRRERPVAQAVADYERLEEMRRAAAEMQEALTAARRSAEDREGQAAQQRRRAGSLRIDLDRARTMGTLRRFFSGLNPERLEREIAASERAAQAASDAARALAEEGRKREARLSELRGELESLVRSVASHPPLAQCRKQLQGIREELRRTGERMAAIDRELAALSEEVLRRCRVLATTVYRTYLGARRPGASTL